MLNMHLPTPWYRGAGKGALNSMPHSINVCTCSWVQLQTQDATVGNTRENCCCAPYKWILYADVYLATALVPSLIACLASSPGSMSRTAVCISRDVSVMVLLILVNLPATKHSQIWGTCTATELY